MDESRLKVFIKEDNSKSIVFDLDGTLANLTHRQHYLRRKVKDWKSFKEEAFHDAPFNDIIWLLKTLKAAGNRIVICTARTEDERPVTEQWLKEKAGCFDCVDKIYMRKSEDYRDDSDVKAELYKQILEDGYDVYMVFDDRNRVVDSLRELGYRVLQVAPGNF